MSGNLTNSSLASRSLWVVLGLVALAAAGCPDAIFLEDPDFETNRDTGSDVEPDGSGEGSGQLPPADLEDPTVEITSPNDGSSVEATTVVIEGTANDDSGIASVWVQVGPNAPVLVDTQTSYRTWSIEVDAPVGTFPVEAVAYDADYQVAGPPDSILLNRTSAQPDSGAPTVTIRLPRRWQRPALRDGSRSAARAFDDRAVVRMETYLNGELRTERSVETDDFFANWNRLIALVPGELNTIEIIAYDAMGNSGSASIDLTGRSRVDEDPPEVEILSHSDGDTIDTGTLALEGTAFDRAGIRELKVRVGTPTDNSTIWSDYVFATTTDGYTSWNVDLDVDPGEQVVEARAIDVNGLATSEVITLFNDFVPEWSEEETFFLRLRENEGPNLIRMELDRQGVSEVINEDIQQAITLLELDPVPLLTNTLNEIKYACGSDWERNNSNDMNLLFQAMARLADAAPDKTLVYLSNLDQGNPLHTYKDSLFLSVASSHPEQAGEFALAQPAGEQRDQWIEKLLSSSPELSLSKKLTLFERIGSPQRQSATAVTMVAQAPDDGTARVLAERLNMSQEVLNEVLADRRQMHSGHLSLIMNNPSNF